VGISTSPISTSAAIAAGHFHRLLSGAGQVVSVGSTGTVQHRVGATLPANLIVNITAQPCSVADIDWYAEWNGAVTLKRNLLTVPTGGIFGGAIQDGSEIWRAQRAKRTFT